MCVNIRDFSVTYSSKLNEVPSIFLRNKEGDIEKKNMGYKPYYFKNIFNFSHVYSLKNKYQMLKEITILQSNIDRVCFLINELRSVVRKTLN